MIRKMSVLVFSVVLIFALSAFAQEKSKPNKAGESTPAKKESVKQEQKAKDEKKIDHKWVNIFPIGMEIRSFVIDPQDANIIYALVNRGLLKIGLFKSVDGGKLWTLLNTLDLERGAKYIREEIKSTSIVIDPTTRSIFLGLGVNEGYRGVLWKSKDGGLNWEDISGGVIEGVADIAINPKSLEIIYAISGGKLFKTLNGGKTWGEIAKSAHSVFLNPNSPDEVYASLEYVEKGRFGYDDKRLIGIHRSTDGGKSFKVIEPPTYIDASALGGGEKEKCAELYGMLNPYNEQEMFAICYGAGECYGKGCFFKSLDSGKSWTNITSKEFIETRTDPFSFSGRKIDIYQNIKLLSVAFSPKDKNIIYIAGRGHGGGDLKYKERKGTFVSTELDKILKSTDGGKIWTTLPFPPYLDIKIIKISSSNLIYVTTDHGIYKSVDEGTTWESASLGLPAGTGDKRLLLVDRKDDTIYIGAENGYWTSNNNGALWTWQNEKVRQIITTNDQTTYVLSNVLKKVTLNQEPVEIKTPYPPQYLAVSPFNSQILYIANGLLLKSEDAGFSWAEIKGLWDKITTLSVDPQSSNIVYVISNAGSLLKTLDGGKTWMTIDVYGSMRTLMQSIWSSSKWLNLKERSDIASRLVSSLTSLVIDPSNSNIVYVVTSTGGVYRSDDGGKNWKLKSPMDYLKTLVSIFDDYSSQKCKEKKRKDCKVTLNNSTTMKSWQVGFFINVPPNYVIVRPEDILNRAGVSFNNISINPSDPKTIYLATNVGVYKSSNRGDTWQLLNQGLLEPAVRKVIASPSVVLAEGESGIYRLLE